MTDAHLYSSDVAFTPAVKAIQARKGSREAYAHVEENGGWRTEIDDKLAAFLADTNSFFLATASVDGQPYIQHRGGPKGFIKVLDKTTIAFADYAGNRQYITQGNLSENPRAHIFIMDYAHRRRVKIWGEARVVDDDPALLDSLMPKGYRARPMWLPRLRSAMRVSRSWRRNSQKSGASPNLSPEVAHGEHRAAADIFDAGDLLCEQQGGRQAASRWDFHENSGKYCSISRS